MAELHRLVARLEGWPGAPGYMSFYCSSATPFRSSVVAFLDSVKGLMPSTVTITVPSAGDIIDDTNGQLVGAWTEGTEYVTAGGQPVAFAAPAGACVSWLTGGIVDGRRVRGRTFLVPLASNAFQTDGTLLNGNVTILSDAAVTLFTSCDLAVWSRPKHDKITGALIHGGSSHEVIGSAVADRAAILKSRRG